MRIHSLFGVLLAFVLVADAFGESESLLLENAKIVDVAARTIVEGHVLVKGKSIEAVLSVPPKNFKGTRIDIAGKWVLPGLGDFHVHAHGNESPTGAYQILGLKGAAQAMLYAGVTGFLDLFNEENLIFDLRNRQRAGKLASDELFSDIFAVGSVFTSTGGHGTEYGKFTRVINTPEQAELEISALAYKKPDAIKIIYDHTVPYFTTLDKATLKRAIKIAQSKGIKTVVHIGNWEDAEQVIDDGADCIAHVFSSEPSDALVQKIVARKITVIPTLAGYVDFVNMVENPKLLKGQILNDIVPPLFLGTYGNANAFTPLCKKWLDWQRRGRPGFMASFRKLLRSGVRMVAGSDAGDVGTFQGYSLHRELELMVEAGASPWEALSSGTINGCSFLGRKCGFERGAAAHLLVLERSPVESIANTQKIQKVFYSGKLVNREELRKKILNTFCQGCGR